MSLPKSCSGHIQPTRKFTREYPNPSPWKRQTRLVPWDWTRVDHYLFLDIYPFILQRLITTLNSRGVVTLSCLALFVLPFGYSVNDVIDSMFGEVCCAECQPGKTWERSDRKSYLSALSVSEHVAFEDLS